MSTAVAAESRYDWAGLLRLWQELDVPEGWRAELSHEGITMTPPPANSHVNIADIVHRTLVRAVPDEYGVHQTLGIAVEQAATICIPDLCVVRGRLPGGTAPTEAARLSLAVEITSPSGARHDRTRKKWAYAHGGVPLYLLVDRFDEDGPAVTLFSEPHAGAYARSLRRPFGDPMLLLPPPFDVDLDTSGY